MGFAPIKLPQRTTAAPDEVAHAESLTPKSTVKTTQVNETPNVPSLFLQISPLRVIMRFAYVATAWGE